MNKLFFRFDCTRGCRGELPNVEDFTTYFLRNRNFRLEHYSAGFSQYKARLHYMFKAGFMTNICLHSISEKFSGFSKKLLLKIVSNHL